MSTRILTPAFIFDSSAKRQVAALREAVAGTQMSLLYSLKACAVPQFVSSFLGDLDGVSVSSVFEVSLARALAEIPLHWVSVAFNPGDVSTVAEACDYVTFNSEPLARRFVAKFRDKTSIGLRANPAMTIVDDLRYDACRYSSKLGLRGDRIVRLCQDLPDVSGIHLHTACGTTSFEPLHRTIRVIEKQLAPQLHRMKWINLGGGYQWDEATDFGPLQEAVDLLTNKYGLRVFFEPGDGIVNSAGSLHASVIDIFESDGKTIAILDTTVNHLPEVFEYQYEPDVAEHVDGAPFEYTLSGCSCLAGDLFGEYTFEEPLDIGSRITFKNVGAYSLVKATMFNGINLPSINIQREDGEIELIREFTDEDFLARCGGEAHAAAPAGV